jgi:hypothetical protein
MLAAEIKSALQRTFFRYAQLCVCDVQHLTRLAGQTAISHYNMSSRPSSQDNESEDLHECRQSRDIHASTFQQFSIDQTL